MTSSHDRASRGGPRSLVGRAHEVALVDQLLDEAQAGLGGSLVLSGEPGIGKSVIVGEALRRARARGFAAARAFCVPIDGRTLTPIADVLAVLMGDRPGSPRPDMSLRAAVDALQRMSQATPLLLVVEDVHWADPSAIASICWLARQLRDRPVAWIVTARRPTLDRAAVADRDVAGLLEIPGAVHAQLSGLTEPEVGALIEASPGRTLVDGDVASIHRLSRGNPLLAEELSRAVTRGEPDLPPLVDKLFGDALRGVEDTARQVLTLCALAGGTIRHELLERAGAAMSLDVEAGARAALDHGLLVRRPEASALACRHPLLAEVAGATTDAAWAREVHETLARELEREPGLALSSAAAEVAHHRSRAGDDVKTLAALLAAADEADGLDAPGSVLAHLEKAIELHPRVATTSPPLGPLLLRASYAAEVVGRNRDAVRLARQSLSVDGASGPELGARYLHMAEMLRRGHHPPAEADAAVERAAELIGDDRGLASLQLAVARCWHWDTDPAAALVHGREAIAKAEAMSAAPLLAQALVQTGGAMTVLGDVAGGIALARRGRAVATEAGFEIGALTSYIPTGAMFTFAGDPSAGADELRAGLDRCQGVADSTTLRAALAGWAAHALFCAGRWAEASDLTVEAQADGIYAALLPLTTARLAAFHGRTDTAVAILGRCTDGGAAVDPQHVLAAAWIAWCEGETSRAHRVAGEALTRGGLPAAAANELSFLSALCRPSDDAAAVLPGPAEAADGPVISRHWAISARAAARDEEGLWRAALDSWRSTQGWPHMVVLCSTRLALRTDAARARPLLIDALALAKQLDSPVLESHVVAAATTAHLALGADESAGPRLTPRETEVLQQLTTGASNRQIARVLGISEGTVSVHVSNLLRKLGVGSRTEAALAAARGLAPR